MPLVANVTARQVSDAATIRKLLVDQVTGTVRWRESVQTMKSLNVSHVFELGAGKVLAGLVKRIAPGIQSFALADRASLEQALASIRNA